MCGTPYESRSTSARWSIPSRRYSPSIVGSGRYTRMSPVRIRLVTSSTGRSTNASPVLRRRLMRLDVVRAIPRNARSRGNQSLGRPIGHVRNGQREREPASPPDLDLDAVGGRAFADEGEAPAHRFGEIEFGHLELHSPRLHFRQVEHVVDEGEEVMPGRADVPDVVRLLFVELAEHPLLQDVGETDDRVQRCAELVRHLREEFALVPARSLNLARRLSESRVGGGERRSLPRKSAEREGQAESGEDEHSAKSEPSRAELA